MIAHTPIRSVRTFFLWKLTAMTDLQMGHLILIMPSTVSGSASNSLLFLQHGQVTANSAEENKTITNGQFDIPFWLASCGRRKEMQEVHVACPCCKNKRLFDADPEAVEGIIKIKCPICKSVIAVSFHRKKVRTERIGV